MIEISEILTLMPHNYPFLLVDRIVELEPQKRIVGIKNVTFNEPFFPATFPASRSCRECSSLKPLRKPGVSWPSSLSRASRATFDSSG